MTIDCDLGACILCGRDLWLDIRSEEAEPEDVESVTSRRFSYRQPKGSRSQKNRYRATHHKNRFNWVLTD